MGVNTTTDKLLEDLKGHFGNAIENLNLILDSDTWGHDDLKEEYIDMLIDMQSTLRKMQRKI